MEHGELARLRVLRKTTELFWDNTAPDCIARTWPEKSCDLNAYELGEETNLLLLEGNPELAAIVEERMDIFVRHLTELGYPVETWDAG